MTEAKGAHGLWPDELKYQIIRIINISMKNIS
jgi:hypothetical protein